MMKAILVVLHLNASDAMIEMPNMTPVSTMQTCEIAKTIVLGYIQTHASNPQAYKVTCDPLE